MYSSTSVAVMEGRVPPRPWGDGNQTQLAGVEPGSPKHVQLYQCCGYGGPSSTSAMGSWQPNPTSRGGTRLSKACTALPVLRLWRAEFHLGHGELAAKPN